MKLYLCTLYPGGPITPEMLFSASLLMRVKTLEIYPLYITGGKFSHRHPKSKADKIQCKLRQKYLDLVPDGEWLLILDSDESLWGDLDKIEDALKIMNYENKNYGMISEFLPNGTVLGRPRLIKKRKGLQYGGVPNKEGVMWKHDIIAYKKCSIIGTQSDSEIQGCPYHKHQFFSEGDECTNYIDVTDIDNSFYLAFMGFNHHKSGEAMDIFGQIDKPINVLDYEKILGKQIQTEID